MITILLVCVLVAGDIPPALSGWEVVRILGKTAQTEPAAVDMIPLPIPGMPHMTDGSTIDRFDPAMPPRGIRECKIMMDGKTMACPKQAPLADATPQGPRPAEQAIVTLRRVIRIGDDIQMPKGCEIRVEDGKEAP